jgi:hypothetical protein
VKVWEYLLAKVGIYAQIFRAILCGYCGSDSKDMDCVK